MTQNDTQTGLHVLVVDDYENMRTRLREQLLQLGHKVSEATNGLDALKYLLKHQMDQGRIITQRRDNGGRGRYRYSDMMTITTEGHKWHKQKVADADKA